MIRVFTLKNAPADEAAVLIRPLLSNHGSLTLHSKTNSISVKDVQSRLRIIDAYLAKIDLPPRSFRVAMKMVQGSTVQNRQKNVADEIRGIGVDVQMLFPFKAYEVLANNTIEGLSGDIVSYRLNESFHVEFYLHNLLRYPGIVQLKNFRLFRVDKQGNNEVLRPILRTTINLKLNQNHVVGISNSTKNSDALIFILRATQQ